MSNQQIVNDEYRNEAADAQTSRDDPWLLIANGYMNLVCKPLKTKAEDFAKQKKKHKRF